jgi:gamma-glutamyltranspeptidase/glutathione hydrolase
MLTPLFPSGGRLSVGGLSLLLVLGLSLAASGLRANQEKALSVEGRQGMVVSVSAPASEAGLAILKQGGNAVDAAVATAFALAVTFPEAGNIGGGGFMLVYPGRGADPVVIDYRETAPAAATPTMFLQAQSSRSQGGRCPRHGAGPGAGPPAVRQVALVQGRWAGGQVGLGRLCYE